MGGKNYRFAVLPAFLDQFYYISRGQDIQSDSRFIKDHHTGIVNHGSGNGYLLLHTGRKLGDAAATELMHVKGGEQVLAPLAEGPAVNPVQIGKVFDGFPDCQPVIKPGVAGEETESTTHLLSLLPQTELYRESSEKVELEFCPYLFPEFVFTGHEVCRGGAIELPERYSEYFDLIKSNPDIFSGFFHIDLENNVLPKLELLRQFGFYPEPEPTETAAESCGAHSPRVQPQELATRAAT